MSEDSKSHDVLHLNMEEIRALWSSAFASAVVSLQRWIPDDLRHGEDIRTRRRMECVVLANFAVQEYRAARDQAPERTEYDYELSIQNKTGDGTVTIHVHQGKRQDLFLTGDCTITLDEPPKGTPYE